MTAPTTQPSELDLAVWAQGARTVKQVVAESGLSRNAVWELMNDGTFVWCVRDGDGWGTRLIAWSSVVRYLASLPKQST